MKDKPTPIGVSVDDILAAMGQADGYLDITPDDALALYRLALSHAVERVRLRLTVGRLMTREVQTFAPGTPAVEVARQLAEAGISGAPVVEGGQLVGVVSIKDFLPRLGLPKHSTPMALVSELVGGKHCGMGDFASATARELMTSPPLTVGPDTPVGEAAALMDGRGINRLPVVENGSLVGIITRGDVVRASQSLKIAE